MSIIRNQILKTLPIHLIVLIASMALCGIISLALGKDLSWDLANYHYYNPFALLHHRHSLDIWPGSFAQAFFTPTIDLLPYYLINHHTPFVMTFMMGALHGINVWLVFTIALVALKNMSHTHHRYSIALLLALLGIYGPTALPGMGSLQQDNTISLFILSFIALQLKFWQSYRDQPSLLTFFLSSFSLGLAIGLKLTAGIYAGGALLTLLFMSLRLKSFLQLVFLLGLGTLVGVMLTSGYWMLFLWQHYHNPIFPFFNKIFHSPYFTDSNWRDTRFLHHNLIETLFFPFFFAWNNETSELPFMDFRYALVYIAFIYYGINLYKGKIKETTATTKWLLLFFLCSYIVWQYSFSILRYLVSLEMLTPLVIYVIIQETVSSSSRKLFFALAAVFIFFTMSPVKPVRAPWFNGSYFNVQLPPLSDTDKPATVLMPIPAFADYLDPRPQTYLIPFLPSQWRFMGIPFWQTRYEIPQTIKALAQTTENVFLLAPHLYMPMMKEMAIRLGFHSVSSCGFIKSDRQKVTFQPVEICQVK